ncbi:MAG: methyl-accepting chemotaxis protein, partial [Peptococcaceae bacterium]|nr:methyl-accepting chemotaxis protein [Peptococcaceae bacterium]
MIRRYSLQLSMGIIILIFAVAMGIAIYGLNMSAKIISRTANTDLEALSVSQEIQFQDLALTDAVRGIIIDPSSQQDFDTYNVYAEKINNSIKRMMVLDPSSKATFNEIDALNVRLIELETIMMEKAGTSPQEAVTIYKGEYTDLRKQLQSTMDEFVSTKKQNIISQAKNDARNSTLLKNIEFGVGLVAIAICIMVGLNILRSIVTPARNLSVEVCKIAAGDLTADKINVRNKNNEIGQLAEAFNKMLHYLKEIIFELNEKSQVVASSAVQLSASSENVSQGATVTASSILEVASTVDQVSQNTQKIADASNKAEEYAEEGNEGIGKIISQMKTIMNASLSAATVVRELNDSNVKISKIVNI